MNAKFSVESKGTSVDCVNTLPRKLEAVLDSLPILNACLAWQRSAIWDNRCPEARKKSVTKRVCFCTGFCLFLLISTGVDAEVHQTRNSLEIAFLYCTLTRTNTEHTQHAHF